MKINLEYYCLTTFYRRKFISIVGYSGESSNFNRSLYASLWKSKVILDENLSRKYFSIFNNTDKNLFIYFGPTASKNLYSIKLEPNKIYESKTSYTGPISGILEI